MKTILVTGGCGFIGSNFIPFFLERHRDAKIINLDLLTYAGRTENLLEVESHPRYEFIQGDIGDEKILSRIFSEPIDGVINFAAESHVDNSIEGPRVFFQTNVMGTQTLIEKARRQWMSSPKKMRSGFENNRFLHVSTDEVYGTLGEDGLFTEMTSYAPNSPYSASKAASDFVVRAYFHTFGMNVVTTNCSNNYGPKQHDEKLIPTIIRKALSGEKIPIYGNGTNIRDWLYVLDHCEGIALAFERGRSGETYNIGGRNERRNLDVATMICALLDESKSLGQGRTYKDQIFFVTDRPGHDQRYAIDASKIESELKWKANESFETGLRKTVQWYLEKRYMT